jgi:transcriptional regulator with XRE-family HTH domain
VALRARCRTGVEAEDCSGVVARCRPPILVARELTGLSQRKLAARASQPALAKLETGNGVPSIRTLLRIAEAAGFELVIGLRRPKSTAPDPEALQRWGLLGVLQRDPDDGLADFVVLREPSPLEGPR